MNENKSGKSSLLCAVVSMIVVSVAVGSILHRKGILRFECNEGCCRKIKCCCNGEDECSTDDMECCSDDDSGCC
jgi:hypothetical protein